MKVNEKTDVLSAEPVVDLVRRWYPDVPVLGGIGTGAYATSTAQETIGFRAEHLIDRSETIDSRRVTRGDTHG